MKRAFDLVVIFAEMRTGSNHLEAMLDGVSGLKALGEAFNPSFVGRPNQDSLLGFDLMRREADPQGFLAAILADGAIDLPVIRFFHDHDARVLGPILDNPRIAKVILRRNPLDSYLSHKIATETGQWKMTDARARKTADVRFVAAEFETMLAAWQGFAAKLRRALQTRGQTAFEIGYDDLADKGVLDGLLRFLGSAEAIDLSASNLKPQNPEAPGQKVINPGEMEAALAKLDPFDLSRPGPIEPSRAPMVKQIAVQGEHLFLPIPGVTPMLPGPDAQNGMSQKELRQWMRQHTSHTKITCIQHPLARAHSVFCHKVLPKRPAHAQTRRQLRMRYDVPLPEDWPDASYTKAAHRAAFEGFLMFLKGCVAGQTSLEALPAWAGQLTLLQGYAQFVVPDRVFRAETLATELPSLGLSAAEPAEPEPFDLAEIYDRALEDRAREVYRRDYVFFGYGDWSDYAA